MVGGLKLMKLIQTCHHWSPYVKTSLRMNFEPKIHCGRTQMVQLLTEEVIGQTGQLKSQTRVLRDPHHDNQVKRPLFGLWKAWMIPICKDQALVKSYRIWKVTYNLKLLFLAYFQPTSTKLFMIKNASNDLLSNIKVVDFSLLFPNWERSSSYHV